tara:strand:- start:1096 stop:1827 length:732 start_codon:yes stop_codon:yes gene_type:complete
MESFIKKDCPLMFGCEYEIEDVIGLTDAALPHITITNDGSLRNNGKEFITSPLDLEASLYVFDSLHSKLECGANPFTDRTSIHVHVNCCNLELDEVRNIVLLYALFEESFFRLVSNTRRNNIHCVALTETFLPAIYRVPLATMVSKWHKYTALNLKPLATQGTIEFRHMHGHADTALLRTWLTVIANLFAVGKTFTPSIETLSEDSLGKLFTAIFGDTPLADDWGYIREQMENQLLDVKLATL